MPETSNGHKGWISVFLELKWPAQVAAILSVPATIGGGTAGVSQFWKPDPAVAETRNLAADTNEKVATLIQTIESQNSNTRDLVTLMLQNICENSADAQWMLSFGQTRVRYCADIEAEVIKIFARGAWRVR